MKERAWANEYRATVVCVDTFEKGVPTGTFFNSYRGESVPFHSTVDFLLKMEQSLDDMNFPQSFRAARSFPVPAADARSADAAPGQQVGRKATFVVKVLFRQNASWQGSVSWLEGKVEQSFRSALELLFLMDSALKQ